MSGQKQGGLLAPTLVKLVGDTVFGGLIGAAIGFILMWPLEMLPLGVTQGSSGVRLTLIVGLAMVGMGMALHSYWIIFSNELMDRRREHEGIGAPKP